MQEILDLIDKYIDIQSEFWNNSDSMGEKEENINAEPLEWMKKEWSILDKMDETKKEILGLISNDRELFNKYLTLGSCLKHEDYEQAEIIKTEIINYGKAA